MIQSLRVVRAAAVLEVRHLATSLFMLFCVFVQPLFIAVTVMFMLRHRPDFDPVYVVVGSALSGIWSVVLFDGNWIIGGERRQGTLELVVGSPTPLMLAIGGKLVGTMAFSVLSMVLSYAIGAWLFGYAIAISDPLGFGFSLILGLAALWATGMLLAPLGVMWRAVSHFVNVLEYPVYAFGGFLFPILLLPDWSRPVSFALPPYWAAVALHATSSGQPTPVPVGLAWLFLALSGVAALGLARPFFLLVLARARRDGSLSLT